MSRLRRTLRQFRSSRLVRRDFPCQSVWQVIGWWEARRIAFNLVIGSIGAITAVVMLLTGAITEAIVGEPIGVPDPPIVAVLGAVVFIVVANVCFTGGWVAESLVRHVWPEESEQFGTLSLTLGLLFSAAVTLLPAVLFGALALGLVVTTWIR